MNTSMYGAPAFERIFSFVVMGLEGGGVLHDRGADDPDGGPTFYGISRKQHPNANIRNEQDARNWYFENVWSPMFCGKLPGPVALVAFDMRVNPTKIASPIMTLQEGLGVVQDGSIGPKTIAAAETVNMPIFLNRIAHRRLTGYLGRNDAVEEANEKGWAMRVHRVSIEALCWHFGE